MPAFIVDVSKMASIEVEADDMDMAEQIARDQEADGSLGLDLQVDVRPLVLNDHSINQWIRMLDDKHSVSVYESDLSNSTFGFTGCESDEYETLTEAVHAAVIHYGLAEVADIQDQKPMGCRESLRECMGFVEAWQMHLSDSGQDKAAATVAEVLARARTAYKEAA